MDSAQIRNELVRILKLDLIGPSSGDAREEETLDRPPSREYLTGFLIPFESPSGHVKPEVGADETEGEQIDLFSNKAATDDDQTPEGGSARRAWFPSSIGISVLISKETSSIAAKVEWGEYKKVEEKEVAGNGRSAAREQWKRTQRRQPVPIKIGAPTVRPQSQDVPESGGLKLMTSVRKIPPSDEPGGIPAELVPSGTRSVSVFLVNYRPPKPDLLRDEAYIFQARLIISSEASFVPRPNLRGLVASTDDRDEQIADLQYRDCYEYAVGHGVSTSVTLGSDGTCSEVRTEWIPTAAVEKVETGEVKDVELSMDGLGAVSDAATMRARLSGLPAQYAKWIEAQGPNIPSDSRRKEVAEFLIGRAQFACKRIEAGIAALEKPDVLEAFRIANRAMAQALRQRQLQMGIAKNDAPPAWYPFQLAFILMNLPALADPLHSDRGLLDLLFFPTAGGKTEAYLGLAAFTLALRRLRNPGVRSAGMSVLMRYTLRLLTLEQLSRAATMICALEFEREKDIGNLGEWPFEIGLWVGMAATPNRMGRKGDQDQNTARAKTIAFKNDDHRPSPIPLENCPWCGAKFTRNSFFLRPNADLPRELRIVCINRDCAFKGDRPLPIVAIDEQIYRRIPCFIIATVDKFAGLPWLGHTGTLFGRVERYDKEGFYGPCDTQGGNQTKLEGPLLPPDLIIQDELHLISGPLGTMAGLYETAIDALSTREVDGKRVSPKVVASTATVRRAEAQVHALFARSVEVFPPPGIDRRDSFFAVTAPERNPRIYTGVAAQGRSLKVVLLRTYLALLAAAQRMYEKEGRDKNPNNPADPYMTLVGYFGSLRELGGSRRIIEDEVNSRLQSYATRKRPGETEGPFADRKIDDLVVELTSRESTDKVADAKRKLALDFREKESVDIAIATNMISVGLDITRLGLMVVLGQPKSTAEYIQATSRVGREDQRPGLVVTLLNIHRPRDRSHYERFEAYHNSFYRGVEATSVTPFSPRAVDRGLAAVTVALARHGLAAMTAPRNAAAILKERVKLEFVTQAMMNRAEQHNPRLGEQEATELRTKLAGRVSDLLDEWAKIANEHHKVGSGLQYGGEEGSAPPLLFAPLDPALDLQPPGARKFKAQRSMRDVEANVNLWVRRMDGIEVEDEEA